MLKKERIRLLLDRILQIVSLVLLLLAVLSNNTTSTAPGRDGDEGWSTTFKLRTCRLTK